MVAGRKHPSHEWLGYFQSISPITCGAEAGEKTSETVIQKIFANCPRREAKAELSQTWNCPLYGGVGFSCTSFLIIF
jgi:hypothetical protein